METGFPALSRAVPVYSQVLSLALKLQAEALLELLPESSESFADEE
jgi:hypothetical protein